MSLRNFVFGAVKAGLASLPLKVRTQVARHCVSIDSGLELLQRNGFAPSAIIDVGAFSGEWSELAYRHWPDASIFMFDGDPAKEDALKAAEQRLGSKARSYLTLLGPEPRERIRLYQLGAGSSVLKELSGFEPSVVEVPMETLDRILANESLGERVLLKLDVQGFELEVLRGASEVLSRAETVILEVALLPYNDGAPLFAEVVQFMADAGFVAYELCGGSRRVDLAPVQVDAFFVRRDSPLRQKKKFRVNDPYTAVVESKT